MNKFATNLKQAILAHPAYSSPLDKRSYESIYCRIGIILDTAKAHIDGGIGKAATPEDIQAMIDEAITTLNAQIIGLDLPWVPANTEIPYWTDLSLEARNQLELFADWADHQHNPTVSTKTLLEEPTKGTGVDHASGTN